jgi:membrane peptidoglycan carboxypeptidase
MKNMGRYWPSNSPNRYDGHISVNEAVIKSKNTTAVKLVKDSMGVDYVYDFALNTLHLHSLVDADKNVAPLALGGFTYGLTVMEMTAAYSIFPNEGYYSPPRLYTKVLRPDGTLLLDRRENEEEYVISKATSTVMTKILENVVWSGTASKIKLKH